MRKNNNAKGPDKELANADSDNNEDDDEEEADLSLASVTVNDSTLDVLLIASTIELGINDIFFSFLNSLIVSSVPIGISVR
jgi:hypothetical protein